VLSAIVSPHPANPAYTANVQFVDTYNGTTTTIGSAMPATATGLATMSAIVLGGGTHNITAQYLGDANYPASNVSGSTTITVAKANPSQTFTNAGGTTGATVSFGTVQYGHAIFGGLSAETFAQACGTCAFPTGSVTVTVGGATIGTFSIGGSGVVTLPSTLLPATANASGAAQNVSFTYPGDVNYANDPVGGMVLITPVSAANETFTLTSSPNPSNFGQQVTIVFTIAPNPAIPGSSPGGTVALLNNGNPLATVNVVNGVGSYTTSALPNGINTITVAPGGYSGDTDFSANTATVNLTGGPAANPNSQVVGAENTVITVSPSSINPPVGATVTYTITVTGTPAVPVGSYTLLDNGNNICTPSGPTVLTGGATSATATCTITYNGTGSFAKGAHSITASFTPAVPANFNTSSSPAVIVNVGVTSTTTTGLTSSTGSPYTYGTLTNLSATVTPSTGFPVNPAYTGTVTFVDNGTNVLCGGASQAACPVPAANNGVATLNGVALGGGTHNLTAIFNGDANYGQSPAAALLTVIVNPAIPVLTVNGAPATVPFGGTLTTGAITLAGVTQNGNAFVAPSGAVTAKSGATVDGTATAGNPTTTGVLTGNYSYSVPFPTSLGTGPVALSFSSAADANYQAVTAATPTTITVTKATTAVTVTSPTIAGMAPGVTPVYGQPITLVATFTTMPGAPLANNDTISFTDGGSALSGCSNQPVVTSGNVSTATCTLPAVTGVPPLFAVGNGHLIGVTGFSGGDPNYTLGTVTPLGFNVAKASTTTLLTSATNPSVPGQSVTFTSVSSVNSPGGEVPLNTAMTVAFNNNGNPITGCNAVAINAAGQATCTFAFPAASSNPITAVLSGDNNVSTSTSATLTQVVGAPQPAITLTSNSPLVSGIPTSNFGAPVTFTSVVTGTNSVTPTGQIQFNDGGTILGTVTLTPGNPAGTATAQITIPTSSANPPFTAGVHAITAVYIPNAGANYSTITSAILVQNVVGATTAITPISITISPVVFGQPDTFSVTVSPANSPSTGVPTGTVTFFDGATAIGNPVALVVGPSSSTATLTGITLSTGQHTNLTAHYNGDSNFAPVTSGAASLTVNKAATTATVTSVSPTLASYPFGTAITLNASVTINAPGAAVNGMNLTGTVSFYDGTAVPANLICTSGPVAGGNANCTAATEQASPGVNGFTASPLIGTHNIIAVYNGSGDPNFLSSPNSAPFAITIGKTNTTTTVTSSTGPSPSASVTGQLVNFTATITPASGVFSAVPTGTVTFSQNGTIMGTSTVTVSGGVATASLLVPSAGVLPLPDGTDLISASYTGDSNYNASSSPATLGLGAFQQIVSKASTTTVLSSSSNSSVVGQNVTLTAIVTVNLPGGGSPTGFVTFNNTVAGVVTPLCTLAPLNPVGGAGNQFIALCTPTTTLPLGNLQLTAVYSGDSNYLGSTSAIVTQLVNKTTTVISMTSSNNPSLFGAPLSFTATVTTTPPGTNITGPVITGTISWFDTGILLGTSVVGAGGTSTFNPPVMAVGTHTLDPQYSGDANYLGVIGAEFTQVINKIPSAMTIVSSGNFSVATQPVTFTAPISPTPPQGAAFATGQVAFYDGSFQIGVGALTGGTASVITTTLTPGLHYISATYSGDGNWTGVQTSYLQQTVNLAQTVTTITSAVEPSVWGQPLNLIVTSALVAPAQGAINGQIQLYDNALPIGPVLTITNGGTNVAFPTNGGPNGNFPNMAVGTHSLIAVYLGSSNFATSSSAALTQIVNKAPTTTSLAVLPTSTTSNAQVTLTAVVNVPLPGQGTPTGSVQFLDTTNNSAVLGTVPIANLGGVWTASLVTTALNQAGAPRLLTAVYSGDVDFASSTSPAQAESVFGTQITVTNAAGYQTTNFAPNSYAAIFVNNFVTTTLVAPGFPLPNSLSGVSVTVTDSTGAKQAATLYFVSPGQIDILLPSNLATGLALITVTNASGATASGVVVISPTAPGIFSANQNGQGPVVGNFEDVTPSNAQTFSVTDTCPNATCVAAPLTMNTTDTYYLILYGTGIRNAAAGTVTATINGVKTTVTYAGPQPQYPGLDQVNLLIPNSLKGAGSVPVVVSVAGQTANTVTITLN
jgi:hypothetical protein